MNENLKYVNTCYKRRGCSQNLEFNFSFIHLFVYLIEFYFALCMGVNFCFMGPIFSILLSKWVK
jgi:hypothetical protein